MPELTKEALRDQLRRRELQPVYVLHGDEPFLRDLAVRTISNLAFSEGDLRDFNETEFSLSDPDNLLSAIAAADQLPMMAARRVIRVCDVRIGAASNRDTLKEENIEALERYLSDPSPSTVIIFIADELNGNRKASRLLAKHAAAVEFRRLDPPELVKWARDRFNDSGARIDDAAARLLVSLVGSDLRRLSVEIDKLITAALPETAIDAELIEELVPYTRELENFDLTDHLVAGRRAEALETLKKILDDGAEPVALLGLISYNYRRLLMAKEMMAAGAPREEVARVVKLRYRDQEPFLAAARRADRSMLLRMVERLASTDLAIKTSVGGGGPAGSRMQIEMLVAEMAMSG